jgi:hypothetical protein
MAVLGYFFERKGVKLAPDMLAPGTCWRPTCWHSVHVHARYIGAPLEWALKLEPLSWCPTCLRPVHWSPLGWAP